MKSDHIVEESQRHSVSGDECPPHRPTQLSVLHRLREGEVIIGTSEMDALHTAIAGVFDTLFYSLDRQMSARIGDLDTRTKVRLVISRTCWGMDSGREGDVRVVVYARKNQIGVSFVADGRWSVFQSLRLDWDDKSVVLTDVACHAEIKAPQPERAECAAWFERQRDRLDAHFVKRLAIPAAIQGEVQ